MIGGVSFDDQDAKLMRGVDVLIATPGRLLDHFERGRLLLTGVELLVIDEADRMLDMGFIPDIERICKLVPFTRQTLFFTATMPPEIRRITEQFLHNPVKVEVSRPATAATTITQQLVKSGREPHDKRETLRRLIRGATENFKNAIVFCNRKREVALLHRSLVKHGFNAVAPAWRPGPVGAHGRARQIPQGRSRPADRLRRRRARSRYSGRQPRASISTCRIHPDDYVHRIGRTGRAGKSGTAYHDRHAGRPEGGRRDREADRPDDRVSPTEIGRAERARTRQRAAANANGRGKSRRARCAAQRPATTARGRRASAASAAPASPGHAPAAAAPVARTRSGTTGGRSRADGDRAPTLSHLPAFLLRPIRVKA